ncbi:tetratricopeptide repeat protein [Micromonospora sp. WMMD736]|uniref:tetratricopeptide repeat protein n=1 Tax=Micromonospora sp. WMMD736 TaxID=3404112 RepID=UPI003B963908
MSIDPGAVQRVSATAGFAYGVIGADLHVFGDGSPVYLLQRWRPPPNPDSTWLRALPSRMLNARLQVVDFTGRHAEIEQLRRWRDDESPIAVRWLHGAGGQGKSRLADHLAADSVALGWRCVIARHAAAAVLPLPGSEDLRLDGTAGVLLVVDYADQWPLSHLTWLLSNALLHQVGVVARVLLLARSADSWPSVRATLANSPTAVSSQYLAPLPEQGDGRAEMFRVARDSFASRYGIARAEHIRPTVSLVAAEMGLTLSVHMAALVAVDAWAMGGPDRQPPPADVQALTIYLLDREHLHWARLFASGEHQFQTKPAVMNRTVFTAALTGPIVRTDAAAVLGLLALADDGERIVSDHAYCYPAADQVSETALEPLYPDRLAEDFLALTLPGHTADYPAQAWAPDTATTILTGWPDEHRSAPALARAPTFLTRGLTFLAAAAERWPHVREGHLYPLLRESPWLAGQAGSAVLLKIAAIPQVDPAILDLVDAALPRERHPDVDAGAAAISTALLPYRLTSATEPTLRADVLRVHAWRLSGAGRIEEAVGHIREIITTLRNLARTAPDEYLPALLVALSNLAVTLNKSGRLPEAVVAAEESVATGQAVPSSSREDILPTLAHAVHVLAHCYGEVGRSADAAARSQEAVALWRRMLTGGATEHEAGLAQTLVNYGVQLSALGRHQEASASVAEALEIYRRLAADRSGSHLANLAVTLHGQAVGAWNNDRRDIALACAQEATAVFRRLVAVNPDAYLLHLVASLNNLGNLLSVSSERPEAMACLHEALGIFRRLAPANPRLYQSGLAQTLINVGSLASSMGDPARAVAYTDEAVQLFRQLVAVLPDVHQINLAHALDCLATHLGDLGRTDEALSHAEEAVAINRLLGPHTPAARPGLSGSLDTLSSQQAALGLTAHALRSAEEAVVIDRALVRLEPDAYLPRLSIALNNLSLRQAACGDQERALATMREVVEIRRQLAGRSPKTHQPSLAKALRNVAIRSASLRRPWEALPPALEALGLERKLAIAMPPAERVCLAQSLLIVATLHAEQGQESAAIDAIRDAVEVYEAVAANGSPAAAEELRQTYTTYHEILIACGRPLEAADLLHQLRAVGPQPVPSTSPPEMT